MGDKQSYHYLWKKKCIYFQRLSVIDSLLVQRLNFHISIFISQSWPRYEKIIQLLVLHITPALFVLCGKPFHMCKAWNGTLKSLPVHSVNGVIISSARVCTLQAVGWLRLLLVALPGLFYLPFWICTKYRNVYLLDTSTALSFLN